MVERTSKPQLLRIFPGPFYNVREQLKDRLESLSTEFGGYVLATGERASIEQFGDFQVTIFKSPEGLRARGFAKVLRKAIRLARAHRRGTTRIDAVVTYDPLKTGMIGWLASTYSSAPLVVEVNGDYASYNTYADINNETLRRMKRSCFMALERFILRRSDGIRLLFSEQVRPFEDCLRNPVVSTFPDYVNLNHFKDSGETHEILFVGHPFYLKGVDLLIEAFKSVSARFPDWRLKILGWFPDPTDLDRAVGGHPRIVVHPPVGHREVAKHMGRCGIFVLPSRSEAMGRVLVEAMASGKPRIGAAVGGIPTVISDGEDGLLFRGGDSKHLAERLALLMSDSDLRRQLGQAGARRAQREFSSPRYLRRMRSLIGKVLESTPNTPSVSLP